VATNASTGWPGGVNYFAESTFPNAWVRMQRQGDWFTAYRSWDGQTWMQMAKASNAYPAQVYIGLCTTAHNNDTNFFTRAAFADWGNTDVAGARTWANLSVNTNNLIVARGDNPPSETAPKILDGNTGTKWLDRVTATWAIITLPSPQLITRYGYAAANDTPSRDPRSWKLSGSTDSNTWVVLDTQVNMPTIPDRYDWRFYGLNNTTPYQYYKYEVTANSGDTLFQISELGLFQSQGAAVVLPELMIGNAAGQITISWPDMSGYSLYKSPALGAGANWTVIGAGTLNGTTRSVTEAATAPKAFYQLQK
jgi:hypothetical protein